MILDLKTKRTAKNAWLNCIDPLNGLSITQAKSIFNAARRNGSPLLQKIFAEIEAADPILMTCVERRQSALAGLGWRAVALASATDEQRAEVQRRALEDFANNIENLDDAIEHLDLGFFRGHSIVQPIWSGHAVRRISLLDSWNFLRDDDGNLLWNPGCSSDPAECDVITPAARIVALVRSRAIDWPALIVYIRKYIGERDWGRFLERYGIPPVDAVMSPNSTNEQKAEYVEGAEAARDGRSVVWPSGTVTSRAEGARGQDPFSPFVQHQEKQIVLMATGGTLTSLAQADTGALAGGAQMDVWEQIVARDGVMISTILNRGLFAPFLRERFPGEPVLAKFELGREDTPSANEAADLAGKIKTAGYTVDQSQLEAATGFTLVKDEISTPGGFGGLSLNKAHGQTPLQNAHKPLQNAPRVSDGQVDPQGLPPSQIAKKRPSGEDAVLEAFAKDTSPAGKAIAALLQNPSKEAAEKLIADLPALLPKEPDLAAVIADAMAAEFAKELGGGEMLTNVVDANGMSHSDDDGRFDGGNGGGSAGADKAGDDIDGEDVSPSWISPVNDITDEDKLEKLTADMKEHGWQGRPIIAINDDGDHWQALTGSHRIAAAEAAGVPVKVHQMEESQLQDLSKYLDEHGDGVDFDEWMSLDDQGKSEWLGRAVDDGVDSLKDAWTLLAREERENNR